MGGKKGKKGNKAAKKRRAVQAHYLQGLPRDLQAIREGWITLTRGHAGRKELSRLQLTMDRLASSADLFSLPDIGAAAREAESCILDAMAAADGAGEATPWLGRIQVALDQVLVAANAHFTQGITPLPELAKPSPAN